jgi:hypothetical protein
LFPEVQGMLFLGNELTITRVAAWLGFVYWHREPSILLRVGA